MDPQMATEVLPSQESEQALQAANLLAANLQEEVPLEAILQEEVQQGVLIEGAAYPLIAQVPLRFHPLTLHLMRDR